MADSAGLKTGPRVEDFGKGLLGPLVRETGEARKGLEFPDGPQPVGNVRPDLAAPHFDGVHEMHGQTQHEGDRSEELVPQAVVEVLDQPLQPGDLPRGRKSLRIEPASDVGQIRRLKLLLLEDRQHLRQDGQPRGGFVGGLCQATNLSSVRDGDQALHNEHEQKRSQQIPDEQNGERGERQHGQHDAWRRGLCR